MSPSGRTLGEAVGAAVRRVRGQSAAAVALAVVALAPAVLLVAWAWGPEWWAARGAGPLILLALALAGAVTLAVILLRRWVRAVDEAAVAAAAERCQRLPQGSLSGVLELGRSLSPGTSAALLGRAESEIASRLSGASPRELAGELGDRARRRLGRLAAAGVVLAAAAVAVGFASPDRARGSWTPLLHPVAHLTGPALPQVLVEPGHVEVPRGTVLTLEVSAPLRSRATVHWRSTGDVPRERTLTIERGRARSDIGPVQAPLTYWVTTPDGAETERFRVRPLDPLLVSGLALEVTYPPHVGREPDYYEGEPPPLRVPEGTRIVVRGTATRPLSDAALRHEDGRELSATAAAASFQLDWRPDLESSGRWSWRLRDRNDELASEAAGVIELEVLPDLPPDVRITWPGRDTLMPAGLQQQVVAEVSDDHGLRAAELVFWRVSAAGERGEPRRVPLRLDGEVDRTQLRTVLDASTVELVQGDAVHYRIAARDNGPAGQVGVSSTYVLRLPGVAELRERARTDADELVDEAERLAERARSLETATRNLNRRASGRRSDTGQGGGRPGTQEQLGFEEAGAARQLMQEHEDVLSQLESLQGKLDELERAIEAAGLRDPELQRRLAEMRELYREMASPERAAELDRMREALEALDPAALRQALEQLAEEQEEFRRQIEESLDMMRRAAAEQEMNSLAREAEDIASQQQALARAMQEELGDGGAGQDGRRDAEAPSDSAGAQPPGTGRPEEAGPPRQADGSQEASREPGPQGQDQGGRDQGSTAAQDSARADGRADSDDGLPQMPQLPQPETPLDRAGQQEELAERANRLNRALDALRERLMQMGEQNASSQAGAAQDKGRSAQQNMENAAAQARQRQGEQAGRSGEQAASDMGDAARTLDAARQQMANAGRSEVEQAVQQATQEALSLAQQEESLRQQMEQAQQQGGAQGQQMQQMRSDQAALQQGLQQLGRNLSEAGRRSAMLDREVGQALARAMLDMERTMEGMQDGRGMPLQQAEQTVNALNQLAMALLQNDARLQQSQSPGGLQQAMQRLARLAQEQASLNSQVGALAPLDLNRQAMQQQMQQVSQQQRGIARRMGEVSEMVGGSDHLLGQLDALSREAQQIAADLEGGRLDPEVMARQERLFHRLLDAGRSLEREEYDDQRVGERPAAVEARTPEALDPSVLDARQRYPAPSAEQLRALPPAYRRLILEYFDRLNRPAGEPADERARPGDGTGGGPEA